MFDGPLMLRVNWPVVDVIYLNGNKFVTGVKINATGDSILNDIPGMVRKDIYKVYTALLIQMISSQQMQKFNESLMAALLYLLSSPETRPYVRADVGLEVYCVACLN